MRISSFGRLTVVAAALLAAACGGSSVTDGTSPPVPPRDTSTTTGPPTVQRASITVRVAIDPADASIASTAGVSAAGLTVRLLRATPGATPLNGTTTADGTVRFDSLLEGAYQISADRALTSDELDRLSPDDRDASVFAGGGDVVLSPPSNASREIQLVATRRGSIVISELFAFNSPPTLSVAYGLGTYIELYNNSDTTVFLDGMLLFRTSPSVHRGSSGYPCEQFNVFTRLDSTALFSSEVMHAFPGTGRDFPVRPGEAKVVAMDALDHRAAAPDKDQVDLSRADFEQIGSDADVDNPFAANLVRVYAGTGILGRGYPYINAPTTHALALPTARAAITVQRLQRTNVGGLGDSVDVYRVPRRYVLDAMGVEYQPGSFDAGTGPSSTCTPWLSPVFERAPARLINSFVRKAISRKSLGRTLDGREILQRTRTAARDFDLQDPLRRSLNK